MKQKILEISKLYKEGCDRLKKAGIAESDLDAWYLLEFVTGISRAMYFAYPDKEVEETQAENYQMLIEQRAKRIPLQHLINQQEFMGLPFFVNENVLIPRQDTEVLVETAASLLRPRMRIADICTGSGCILLSLLKLNWDLGVSGVGVDISEDALKVARKNAKDLGVSCEFVESDLYEKMTGEMFDMIVSNPPYIPTRVIDTLEEEVKLHDPYIALDGKEDGLHFYRRIIKESKAHLNNGGWLVFEIGHDQGESVSNLMGEAGYEEILVKKDLAGLDRVVLGMYNKR